MTDRSVSIKNDNLFISTGGYQFVLRILADGEPVWQSERRFDVPADSACTFDVEWPVDLYRANANELVLEVSQRLAEATDWAPAGYELAFGQTVVAGTKAAEDAALPADGIVTVGRWNAGVQVPDERFFFLAPRAAWSPTRSTVTNSCCVARRSPHSAR